MPDRSCFNYMLDDSFNLFRFVIAQEDVIDEVYAELAAGEKRGHWMWFVFPQIAGLGFSFMAQRYAIQSLEEAKAYLEHPVLGQRLVQCTQTVLAVEAKTADQIFGWPDVLKFRSCMTLFSAVLESKDNVFQQALEKYYGGEPDMKTLQKIN